MAFTLPLIVMMLVGLWEVGRIVEVQQYLFNAAREGARQAATGQFTTAQVQAVALNALRYALNDTTGQMTRNAQVTVVDLTNPGKDPTQAATLDQLQITVTVPYQDVRWTNLSLVTNGATLLMGQITWVCLADSPVPNNPPQPPSG
jgi:Flp pilus assembly protein TadG